MRAGESDGAAPPFQGDGAGLFLVRAIDGAFAGVAELEQLIVHAVVGSEGGFPGIELPFAVFGGDAGRERERKEKGGEERGGFHRAKKTRFAAQTIALGRSGVELG